MTGSTDWIASQGARPHPRLRLFCFPHAGGGASMYRGWGAELPPEVDLCAVQLPGRETRFAEPARPSLEPLVAELADALQPRMDIPFAFFGYSMGTLLAFELARELQRRGARPPVHLIVAAHRGPRVAAREPNIHHLPDDAFIRELVRLNGIPAEIAADRELLEFFLPVLRADVTLCERYAYRPEPPLQCAFTAYGGVADPDVTWGDLEAWALETIVSCTVRMFPGDHFFMRQQRATLLEALHRDLRRVLDAPA